MFKVTLALALAVFTGLSLAQVSFVYWPCDDVVQNLFDSEGQSHRYSGTLPGDAWNEQAAISVAAYTHHQNVKCQSTCYPPDGCVKNINTSYDSATYVSGPEGSSDRFTWTVTNLVVTGFCTSC